MALSSVSSAAELLFSAIGNQDAQRASLSQTSLSRGADRALAGDYTGAAEAFKLSISLDPSRENALQAYDLLATIYLQDGRTEDAMKTYQTMIRVAPDNDEARTKLGNIYFDKGKYNEALREYSTAASIGTPSSAELYSLGQAYLKLGRFSEAESLFKRIISLDPKHYGGHYGLGQAYYREGRNNEALKEFEKVVDMKPDFFDVHVDMGYVYADLQQKDKALEQANILAENAPNLEPLLTLYSDQVTKPSFVAAQPVNGFYDTLGPGTNLNSLDMTLIEPNSSSIFSMAFYFNKEMDPLSVQNPYNWSITRASEGSTGGPYNWGLPIQQTEAEITAIPFSVDYQPDSYKAIVSFLIRQNDSANATIDPSHIIFKFKGTDINGNSMNETADEYSGISQFV